MGLAKKIIFGSFFQIDGDEPCYQNIFFAVEQGFEPCLSKVSKIIVMTRL